MKGDPSRIGQEELRYFGHVTASVSHELKNVLAILNEQVGLLQDYVAIAAQGSPLDPQRIERLSCTMSTQILRGDDIIKRMNRFAHSVDQECSSVDLDELVSLVADLFDRTALRRGVTVTVQHGNSGMAVSTRPFALEALLGHLLDRLTLPPSTIERLTIRIDAKNPHQITVSGLANQAESVAAIVSEAGLAGLIQAVQAHAAFDQERDELIILLPDRIDI